MSQARNTKEAGLMIKNVLQPTDYVSLSVRINTLVEESLLGGYSAYVTSLLDLMREQFPALTQEHNPVIALLEFWTQSELRFIIQEYSGFSNAAIHMFLEARIRNHWPALTKEIIRNMDEEMGTLSHGIPHLELMHYGYRVELGIETDGLRYTSMTEDFIDRMNVLFRNRDNAYLAGALLAFETTAADEFRIVERMLRRYKKIVGGEIMPDSLTGRYIAGHVSPETSDPEHDPEMDHYRGMVEAVRAGMTDGTLQPLVRGFFSVCLELNRWWEQVASEACQMEIREKLAHQSELPDLYLSLRQA
jgi:hypothetical protein